MSASAAWFGFVRVNLEYRSIEVNKAINEDGNQLDSAGSVC